MKVLVYGISRTIGGISEYMMNISKNIDKNEIQFDYLIAGKDSYYEKRITERGGKFFYYTSKKKNYFKYFKELYILIKRLRKDHCIMYFNSSGTYNIFPYLIAIIFKYKIIVHAHNSKGDNINFIYKFFNFINRHIINSINCVKLSCSDIAAEWVFGKNEQYIQINNGIDIEKFQFNLVKRNVIRKSLNISEKDILLGNVGRLTDAKNPFFLLEILKEIHKQDDIYKLIFIGDGELKEELIKKSKELKIDDRVIFYGNSTNVNELLQAMDLFIMPSLYEGFPISLVEAQASGLKCIVSDNITAKVNITGLVKFISLKKDEQYWAEYIMKECEYNRISMNEIIKNKNFDEKDISKKIEEILKKVG